MLLYLTIIIICVILDQVSKYTGVLLLSGVTTLPIIPNVFHLTYVENTGAAFSLFSDMRAFLIIVTALFTLLLGYLFFVLPKTKKYHTVNLALALMIGGAIGNLLDRIRLGYVIDLFDFRIIGFAIFNLADCFVVIGGLLLILALIVNKNLFEKPKRRRRRPAPVKEETMSEEEKKRITPEVQTSIRRLRTNQPVDFSPKPPVREPVFDDRPTQEVIISPKPKRQLKYEEVVEKEPRPANRYRKSSQHYEEMIRAQRSQAKEETSHETENPWEETKTWERPEKSTPAPVERYTGVLDSYEASIKEQRERERREKEAAHEPEEQPKRRRAGVERYTESTDSYLRSIEEASKKHYTED